MIDVAPGEMIAARHEIELVAKVAVAIVEVTVKDQLQRCDRQDGVHSIAEEGAGLFTAQDLHGWDAVYELRSGRHTRADIRLAGATDGGMLLFRGSEV